MPFSDKIAILHFDWRNQGAGSDLWSEAATSQQQAEMSPKWLETIHTHFNTTLPARPTQANPKRLGRMHVLISHLNNAL